MFFDKIDHFLLYLTQKFVKIIFGACRHESEECLSNEWWFDDLKTSPKYEHKTEMVQPGDVFCCK